MNRLRICLQPLQLIHRFIYLILEFVDIRNDTRIKPLKLI